MILWNPVSSLPASLSLICIASLLHWIEDNIVYWLWQIHKLSCEVKRRMQSYQRRAAWGVHGEKKLTWLSAGRHLSNWKWNIMYEWVLFFTDVVMTGKLHVGIVWCEDSLGLRLTSRWGETGCLSLCRSHHTANASQRISFTCCATEHFYTSDLFKRPIVLLWVNLADAPMNILRGVHIYHILE